MQLIRCTRKLLKELKQEPKEAVEIDGLLGGWHANLLTIERRKCVIVLNDATLYTLFIPLLKKPDFQTFHFTFGQHLLKNIMYEGFNQKQIEAVLDENHEIKFAKTNSRSVLGTMNEQTYQLEYIIHLNGGLANTDIYELNHDLNRIIYSATDYIKPIEMLKTKLNEKYL